MTHQDDQAIEEWILENCHDLSEEIKLHLEETTSLSEEELDNLLRNIMISIRANR